MSQYFSLFFLVANFCHFPKNNLEKEYSVKFPFLKKNSPPKFIFSYFLKLQEITNKKVAVD
jgi:hypothetical protein